MFIIFWGFLMVSHELPNNWRLRISGESQNVVEFLPSAKSFSRNENFVSTSKNLLKNRNWTFPAVHYFTLKLEVVSNIWWMSVDSTCQFPQLQKELNKSLKLSLNLFS